MLVLSRLKNERIMIGHDIAIVVIQTRSDKCRLGIEAPKQVSVHREEIYNDEQRQAAARIALRTQQWGDTAKAVIATSEQDHECLLALREEMDEGGQSA